MSDYEFMKQFSGSASANLVTGIVFIVIYIIKNKCKKSTCTSHAFCCDITVNDEEENDPEGGEGRNLERADTKKIPRQIEIKVHKLHSRVDQGVL